MITVTSAYKTAVKGNAKEVYAYLKYGSTYIRQSDDLIGLKIISEGDLGKTVLRQASVSYFGTHSLLGEVVNLGIGVKLANDSIEYIDYGSFLVKEIEEEAEGKYTKAKMYDLMYYSLQDYSLAGITYPLTLKAYLEAICTKLDYTLGTSSFYNDDLSVTADYFAFQGFTFRDVLEQIAEATGTIIRFDTSDELVLTNVSASVNETLTTSEQRKLKLENKWGGLNSLILRETPSDDVEDGNYTYKPLQTEDLVDILLEDNLTTLDTQERIMSYGLFSIVFQDNQFLSDDREGLIADLFSEIEGIEYYPSQVKTIGFGYLEVGDRIQVQDLSSNNYETLVLSVEIEVGTGYREIIKSEVFSKAVTIYKEQSGVVSRTISKSELQTKNIADEAVTTAKIENLAVTTAKIKSLDAGKITTGTLTAVAQVGSETGLSYVKIDGENNRILIADENGVDVIIIGKGGGSI
jgi:hypothetical protein